MSSNIQIIRHCEYCKNPFNAKTTVTRFCSHKCNSRSHKQKIRELKMQVSNQMTQTQVVDTIKESVRKDEVLTVREVAELLKASREAVYFMIKSGRLKATKLSPRNTRIYRSDFEDFFKSEPPAVVPNLRNEKVKEETILTRENCFSVSEVVTLFGQERGNVYSILSRENVPKIKIGKEAFSRL